MSQIIQRTPNGMAIRFQSHKPRGYWIMEDPTALKVADERHKEWGKRLTSVTTVLGVLDKPALKWWGMQIGIQGMLHLVREGILGVTKFGFDVLDPERLATLQEFIAKDEKLVPRKLEREDQQIAKLLTMEKICVNNITRRAAKRGQTAHDAFETWAHTGILPDPRGYIEEQQPYVQALRKFIADNDFTDVQTEVCVASVLHRVGGRYDIRGSLNGMPPGIYDVKTAKDVYLTHFLQMEGYEGMSIENGYEPTAERAVIHLGYDGEWKMMRSHEMTKDEKPVVYEDFLAVLRVSRVVDRLGGL